MTDKSQKEIAQRAMKLKTDNAPLQDHLVHQQDTPGLGPIAGRNQDEPVSGALDAEGQRPVLERSRKVR